MRLLSSDPANEPLLGELSGRWYWDAKRGDHFRNRRRRERRRLVPSPDGGLAYWRELAVDSQASLRYWRGVAVDSLLALNEYC